MKIAFHFPGQGSQSLGMLSELAQHFPIVNDIFTRASDVLGYDLWQLTQSGPEEQLNKTEYTQPAMLAADFAVWECWKASHGADPMLLAGHSLGEYAALVVAESLTFEAAIDVVALRGKAMQAAVPEGSGAMAAIIGLDDEAIIDVCERAANGEVVSPANYNSVGQTVIAGQSDAVDRAIELAKEASARIAKRIPVSVPSHCALMQPASLELAEKLKSVDIQLPKISVIHNVDVSEHNEIDKIREALIQQLMYPVRWVETVLAMQDRGIELFIECGPGKVLSGLNKRIVSSIPTKIINSSEALNLVMS